MIIIGAKGHAKEILDILEKQNIKDDNYFFDNYTQDIPDLLFNKYKIIKDTDEAVEILKKDNRFILGLGGVNNRQKLYKTFIGLGGSPVTVKSPFATIGNHNVKLGKGLNIMHHVSVFNDVVIGDGTLINSFVSIHHDCRIGDFCEISPGARILGRVTVGNNTSIGANAVILPDIKVGNNVTIGAGAVVTKDLPENVIVKGVPAK